MKMRSTRYSTSTVVLGCVAFALLVTQVHSVRLLRQANQLVEAYTLQVAESYCEPQGLPGSSLTAVVTHDGDFWNCVAAAMPMARDEVQKLLETGQ
jgi:hypothetical protein